MVFRLFSFPICQPAKTELRYDTYILRRDARPPVGVFDCKVMFLGTPDTYLSISSSENSPSSGMVNCPMSLCSPSSFPFTSASVAGFTLPPHRKGHIPSSHPSTAYSFCTSRDFWMGTTAPSTPYGSAILVESRSVSCSGRITCRPP